MTQASPLSRLEKLAAEYALRYPVKSGSLEFQCHAKDYLEGCKALLQILSEPGEACGPLPRVDIYQDDDGRLLAWTKEEYSRDIFDYANQNGTFEYVPLTELLQARAALETITAALQQRNRDIVSATENYNRINGLRNESEARVRILTGALEIALNSLEDICGIGSPEYAQTSLANEALTKIASVMGDGEK